MIKSNHETYIAFERDIEQHGAYQYTDGSKLSTRIANKRYSDLILDSANFLGKRVVDVGAGDGTYTAEIARRSGAAFVLGIEPSAQAVAYARKRFIKNHSNLDFIQGCSGDLLKKNNRFDIAIYRGVIHHVANAKEELENSVRIAETIIFLEPNGLNLMMKTVERISLYHRKHQEHSFNPWQIKHWIEQAGGKIGRIKFFGLVPYFCPDWVAKSGRLAEPMIELLPVARELLCGQYLLVVKSK